MKKVLKFLAVIIWPFLLVVGVIIWKQPQLKEKEAGERQEILSDTARMDRAYRTYERIHKQQLMEDPYYYELYEENLDLKDRLDNIKSTAEELQEHIDYFESKGFDVSDMQAIMDNIVSESDY